MGDLFFFPKSSFFCNLCERGNLSFYLLTLEKKYENNQNVFVTPECKLFSNYSQRMNKTDSKYCEMHCCN